MNRKKRLTRTAWPRSGTGLKPGGESARSTPLKASPRKPKAARDTGPSAKVRAVVLERDGYSCVRCGVNVVGIRASIHHRKRRSQGGTNTPDCLVTMCGTGTTGCHGWAHANPAAARDAGWLVRSVDDPAQVPMLVVSMHGSGATAWLTADGRYAFEPPERAA